MYDKAQKLVDDLDAIDRQIAEILGMKLTPKGNHGRLAAARARHATNSLAQARSMAMQARCCILEAADWLGWESDTEST